jgi:membrane protein YqaA with SNARE-associated domain
VSLLSPRRRRRFPWPQPSTLRRYIRRIDNNGPLDEPDGISPAPVDRRLTILLACFGALVVMTNVGSITAPTLVKRSPELLLLLSSRIRHLLFAVPADVNPVLYVVIPTLRIGAAGAVTYLLGRWYGHRGMAWLDRQFGGKTPATFRWLQSATDKAAPLLVFLMPASNIVCVLVGLRKMKPQLFVSCLLAGIAFRLAWVWFAAKQVEEELKDILDWIADYQWYLVVGFMAISVIQSSMSQRRQQRSR